MRITITKKPDGMYYFLSQNKGNITANKDLCQQVPGFDLPVIITQQHYDVAKGFIESDLGRSKNLCFSLWKVEQISLFFKSFTKTEEV